jgi:hypothetical protein
MSKPTDNWKPVILAAKVLGHISQGMYRTPASAIKELISNAYDAGATYVKLHTGFPTFTEFTCEDNGSAMSIAEFEHLMNGGIGDSVKQASEERRIGEYGRPIIGRLGVGLLSIAQICSRFDIISHQEATKEAFEASIKFPPYTRKELDKIVQEAAASKKQLIHNGQYTLRKISYDRKRRGITVTTSHLRETFSRTMSNLDNLAYHRFNKRKQSYPSFEDYLRCIVNPRLSALFFACPYDQLIFGLALASPIPYPEREGERGIETLVVKVPPIGKLQNKLKSFNFQVEVDNMLLRRPLVLPADKFDTTAADCDVPQKPKSKEFELVDGSHRERVKVGWYNVKVKSSDLHYQVFHFDYSSRVNGYPLKFSGYIFLQTTRLFPKEYQGVLVRLRHVAIGQYDVNVMTYPQAEGPRFSFLSSEVFVEEGLDDALKVDRDGFNTLDPHYIRLQAFVHSILHELIFPGSWAEEKVRNKGRREERTKVGIARFSSSLSQITNANIKKVEFVKSKPPADSPIAAVDPSTNTVRVYQEHPDAKEVLGKRKYRGIASRVVAAFEVANREPTPDKRRAVFYKLIENIFNE